MRFILFVQSFGCFLALVCLNIKHGHAHSLKCLNDYLFTIRCELNMSSETRLHDALYWLEFYDEREPLECVLTSQTYPWMCVLNLSARVEETFMDTDIFQISLNYSFYGNNDSVVLSRGYKPVNYIQPVPPSNLALLWKPDKAVFRWFSGYDESIMLIPYLQYQLRIQRNGKAFDIHSSEANLSVPMLTFAPSVNYTARVRSAPHQIHYKGVWSHWGPAIYWTTGPTNKPPLTRVWFALLILPVMLLFYFSYSRCKRCVLDPHPTPHIRDFKVRRSVIPSENMGELLQKEESLPIDSLIEEPNPTYYENDSASHASFAGTSRSPSMLQSSVGSKANASSSTQASMLAEKDSLTYSNDYCTLSHIPSEWAVDTQELNRTTTAS